MQRQRGPIRRPVVMRSRMMLEIASELVGDEHWPDRQVEIHFREQGAPGWRRTFFASDAPNSIDAVASGAADIAICNPGGVLAMALRGAGPFKQPIPVRAITVFPQWDQMGLAVTAQSGITSLAEIRDKRYPLKVSLRGQRDHGVHLVAEQIFQVMGFSLDDITTWGGEVRYDDEFPDGPNRIGAIERGEIDALFDEAMPMWAVRAMDLGMRFLPVEEADMQKLEALGLGRNMITREEYPQLPEDVLAVDFSGWPVFTLESAPDDMVTSFCEALEARKGEIPWYGTGPMRLDLMCQNTAEAPVTIPFHRAAERFWRAQGYLK